MSLYAIVGAGGFGREVMPIARDMIKIMPQDNELVFVVEKKYLTQNVANGYPVISDEDFLSYNKGEKYFNIAFANSVQRERVAEKMIAGGAHPFQVRAHNVIEYDKNEIGEGAILCAGTIITSNAKIGRFFHANLYSYVAHDCIIGDFVTFAPDVHCNGHVVIEDHAYIGTGTVIKDATDRPIVIGKGAIVGMGAVVTKSVPTDMVVIGNPARELRRKA